MVTGHTDSNNSTDYNYNLSSRHAESFASPFAARVIEQFRSISQGMWPDQPLASNTTESDKAQNRRVELKIAA